MLAAATSSTGLLLGLGFLNPLLLWALPLAAVPIIIHLLNRRRFNKVPWAAMEYLLRAMKRNRRRMQMEHWLVLLLRTLAVIFLVFLVGLVVCAYRITQTSRELNRAKPFDPLVPSLAAEFLAKSRGRSGESRAILISTLRLKLTQRIAMVRHTANSLVLLGLIGTVIGFIIALSGVDPDKAGDFNSVAPMVSTLIEGMSTALYTTLVGAVLNVWLMINYRLLAGGTTKLITGLIEFGEDHARA